MLARKVYFSGNVQGVGFRYTVNNIAHRFKVAGFVQNLADGRVYLFVQGESLSVDAFINAISESMHDHIASVDFSNVEVDTDINGFEIRVDS